jgi:hypothetical protein
MPRSSHTKSTRSSYTSCLVGFSNTFCALQQICHFCVKSSSSEHYIKILKKLTLITLSFFNVLQNAYILRAFRLPPRCKRDLRFHFFKFTLRRLEFCYRQFGTNDRSHIQSSSSVYRFEQLYFGNHSELDTWSYEIFLKMTNNITFKIICLSSWTTLYIVE